MTLNLKGVLYNICTSTTIQFFKELIKNKNSTKNGQTKLIEMKKLYTLFTPVIIVSQPSNESSSTYLLDG